MLTYPRNTGPKRELLRLSEVIWFIVQLTFVIDILTSEYLRLIIRHIKRNLSRVRLAHSPSRTITFCMPASVARRRACHSATVRTG